METKKKIERLENTINKLKDDKLTLEVAIMGLESQKILEELKINKVNNIEEEKFSYTNTYNGN